MTRRSLFGLFAAPLLPASPITTEVPDWVVPLGCLVCGKPGAGAEDTIWCAECLHAKRIERIRTMPMAGDEIYGPCGSRIEITTVWVGEICEEPTTLVYYNLTVPGKGTQERMVSLDTWDTLAGWDKARLHS